MKRGIFSIDNSILSFLRSTLKGNSASEEVVQSMDWNALMDFAVKQSIAGIIYEGVKLCRLQYPEAIDKKVLLRWFSTTEKKRRKFALVGQRLVELTKLFEQEGFRTCLLKGHGISQMYPVPESRYAGDIDIWVEGDRKTITDFVHSKTPGTFAQYHHIDFPVFKDVPVEVHYLPSQMNSPLHNHRLQAYYKKHQDEQFAHLTPSLGEGVCTPTKCFNAIFMLSHMMRHFYNEGIGLRQIIDYYYLLKQGFTEVEKETFAQTVKHLGMKKFAGAVMWIEVNVLGLDRQCLLIAPHEKAGQFLAEEIFQTGNFGDLDERYTFRKRGAFACALTDVYRDLLMARMFPSEALWKLYAKVVNQQWKIKDRLK